MGRRSGYRRQQKPNWNRQQKSSTCSSEKIVITANGSTDHEIFTIASDIGNGNWVSLFEVDILGVRFEPVWSTASEASILSSRVYDEIVRQSGESCCQLQEAPGVVVCDTFGNEVEVLGILGATCTVVSTNVTQEITFLVIKGGGIDGVIGAPDISSDMLNFILNNRHEHRPPKIIGMNKENKKKSPTGPSTSTNRPSKIHVTNNWAVNASGVFGLTPDMPTDVFRSLLENQHVEVPNIIKAFNKDKKKGSTSSGEPGTSSDKLITTTVTTRKEGSLSFKMEIMDVLFEAVLSIETNGTILSFHAYQRIVSKLESTTYKLEKVSGIQVRDTTGDQMELLGTFRIPCQFVSTFGSNRVTETITFLVVQGINVDCILGAPEVHSCKMAIIPHQGLLLFNNHKPAIPIAIIGAKDDPSVAYSSEMEKISPIESPILPDYVITITIISSRNGKFPSMFKMSAMGVPFRAVLSTGSNGTVMTSRVHNLIMNRVKDLRYMLEKAPNVQIQDIVGNKFKLLGVFRVPSKIISACGKKWVTEPITYFVVDKAAVDCVFGAPEIENCDITVILEKKKSLMVFENRDPPVEISLLSNDE